MIRQMKLSQCVWRGVSKGDDAALGSPKSKSGFDKRAVNFHKHILPNWKVGAHGPANRKRYQSQVCTPPHEIWN
jgi:hypothetical protein